MYARLCYRLVLYLVCFGLFIGRRTEEPEPEEELGVAVYDVALGLQVEVPLVAVHLDEGPGLSGGGAGRQLHVSTAIQVACGAGLLH